MVLCPSSGTHECDCPSCQHRSTTGRWSLGTQRSLEGVRERYVFKEGDVAVLIREYVEVLRCRLCRCVCAFVGPWTRDFTESLALTVAGAPHHAFATPGIVYDVCESDSIAVEHANDDAVEYEVIHLDDSGRWTATVIPWDYADLSSGVPRLQLCTVPPGWREKRLRLNVQLATLPFKVFAFDVLVRGTFPRPGVG